MTERSLKNLPIHNVWRPETKKEKRRRKTISQEIEEMHSGILVNPFFAKEKC